MSTLYGLDRNMPRDQLELKAMVKKAVQVDKDHPTLKVPEVMRVAKFTLEESQDRTLQMRVRRLIDQTPTSITVSLSPGYIYIQCIWAKTKENPHDVCGCWAEAGE